MHQVVHDVRVRGPGPDANAAAPVPLVSPNRIIVDLDMLGVPQLDSAVRPTCNEVVADDAVANVDEPLSSDIGCGLTGIAEGYTPVAVDDEIAFHHNPSGAHPNEDSSAPAAVAPLDVPEDVVAEGPVFQGHHVNGGNVVAPEQPMGWWDLGVLEVAVANRASHCTDVRVLPRRTLDGAYADVPEAAVIDADVLRCVLRFHLNPVGPTVGEGQVRDGDPFATGDAENVVPLDFAVPPFAA